MIEFGPKEIDSLLNELGERLRARGIAASIYVVGGAAIALRDHSERRTVDIDAIYVPEADVQDVAREIATERGLPPDWLNSSARAWVPPRPAEAQQPPVQPGLARHVAPDEHLLAMKLVASRSRDLPDILVLVESLRIEDPVVMADMVRDVYGADMLEMHGGYDDMVVNCQAVISEVRRRRDRRGKSSATGGAQAREPKGTPRGGQFAARPHQESDVDL
ncbi:DUF6036 family nucleotidyltransferase [Nocardioides pakistanensis]